LGHQSFIDAAVELAARCSAGKAEDAQIMTYLQESRDFMAKQLNAQTQEQNRLRGLHASLEKRIQEIPPPARFREATGLEMVLARAGQNAFYICPRAIGRRHLAEFLDRRNENLVPTKPDSGATAPGAAAEPVAVDSASEAPATGVTWEAAAQFGKWLSARNGEAFRLPTVAELDAAGMQFPCALWTSAEWQGPSKEACDTRVQFGVQMYSVWDRQELFKSGAVFGELPFCVYDDLGFTVVVRQEAGIRNRLNRLKAKL
jgi:hypothetical protein